jgi:ribonuclease HII
MLKPYYTVGVVEAGCDEAGRGCLAGPVFAAAVILPVRFRNIWLNDSKLLSPEVRESLRRVIEKEAISFGVGTACVEEIDRINIANASFLAMSRAIARLDPVPAHLLVDGNRFISNLTIPFTCIIRGDGLYASIAAASILAKTYRDAFMERLHEECPGYGWKNNKGYATAFHREALIKLGPTEYHRRSFNLADGQLNLEFS